VSSEFLSEKDATEVIARLRRIEGQVRGLQKMVEEDRDCTDIVQQLSAARAALDRVGNVMIACGLRQCLAGTDVDAATLERVNIGLQALASLRS
jgi:CsoR family transcriptional regulator, copper-sensing transcriptional repressor